MQKENVNLGPFRATRLWDEAVSVFTQGMPRKRHRSHMRLYEDCFTGSEAVKWFFQALELNPHFTSVITHEKTVQLLNKFFEEGIFLRVKCSSNRVPERFKLHGIYQMSYRRAQHTSRTPLSAASMINQNQKEENWIRKSLRKEPFTNNKNWEPVEGKTSYLAYQKDYENVPLPEPKSSSTWTLKDKSFKNPQACVSQKQAHRQLNAAVLHPLQQQNKMQHRERCNQGSTELSSPGKLDDIWRNIFLEKLQKVLMDVDVSGLLWPGAIIRCQWLEHNCCILDDISVLEFPPWVKAASKRLLQALSGRGMNRSIVNLDIEADVSAMEAFFGSLSTTLIPADLGAVFQRVFLHLEMAASSSTEEDTISNSASSSRIDSDWFKESEIPPNSCFETAFTSEKPVTRIIPQSSRDTLHLSCSPLKRNVSAPKLLESCAQELEVTPSPLMKSPLSKSSVFGLSHKDTAQKYSTIGGNRWENKSKLKNDCIGGSLQKNKSFKLSVSPYCHLENELCKPQLHHNCGQLTVTDKTPPIPPRRMTKPPPLRRHGGTSERNLVENHSRSHSGGYINLALQDSFEDPHIRNEELDLEAAMETLQRLMICSQPNLQRSPRKDCQVKGSHVRSASLSQTREPPADLELRRSLSLHSQDFKNASLPSASTSLQTSEANSRAHTPLSFGAGCEWGWDWGKDRERQGVAVFRLLTLLLPPQSRARLQVLLKLMALLPYQCPYTAVKVLEMFSAFIIQGSDMDLVARLLGFLVRHHKEIFIPPKDIAPEVLKQRHDKIQRRFEEQKLTTSQQALAELLDQILADHKMSSKEKHKKIKMFKESYPHIYALRFPGASFEDAQQKTRSKSILQLARLRSLRV